MSTDLDITATAFAADGKIDNAGDVINTTIAVHNTGNVDLTGLTVGNAFASNLGYQSGDTDHNGVLGVGETWTYNGTRTLTQAEIDATSRGNDPTVSIVVDTVETHPHVESLGVDIENHFNGTQLKVQTANFWATHLEAWDGSAANDGTWKSLVTNGTLSAADMFKFPNGVVDSNRNGVFDALDQKGVLLGDVNGDGAGQQ